MSPPPTGNGPPLPRKSRLAGSAYWAMMRRIVLIAASIDGAWIVMYDWLGSTVLALLNVASVAMYLSAYVLIRRRRNIAAVSLVWLEVLAHSSIGSLLLGWNSGFHYFLLMFIPALVIGTRRLYAIPLVLALMAFYLGLEAACDAYAPLTPLPSHQALQIARWTNIVLTFAMFYSMATFYRQTVLKAERRLLEQATTDPLTRLANRSHFQTRTMDALKRSARHREPVSLILADIDFFKRINDDFGHDAGDKVLQHIAGLMSANLRDIDVLARWGGEEFIALLPASDGRTAAEAADRIRQAVQDNPAEVCGFSIVMTMSFGVTEVRGEHDLQPATLRADHALYRSKKEGRNCVRFA